MKGKLMRKTLMLVSSLGLMAGLTLWSHAARGAAAQEQVAGDWSAKVRDTDKGKKLWLELRSEAPDKWRRFNMSSSDYNLEDFTGFNPNANGATQFALSREAGDIVFTGLVSEGKGVGDFRFTPNGAYLAAMRNLGYDDINSDRLFALALHDVSTRFVQETKAWGFDKLPLDKLIAFRIFKVDADFIREMRDLGFKDLSPDKLISMKIHKVNAAFIKDVEALGFKDMGVDKLVAMRIHKVDREFIAKAQALGFNNLTIDQLITTRHPARP